jgi:hypothetical protein
MAAVTPLIITNGEVQRADAADTVTGGSVAVSDGTDAYVEVDAGSTAAVSPAGAGRIRYDEAGNKLQISNNGAAYADIGAGSSGDVSGPGSATDDAIATFNGTGGKTIQNSPVTVAQTTGVMRTPGTVEWDTGADVASAAALALLTDGNYFDVTGTTTITSVSSKAIGTRILLHFDSALTVTHNATTLVLAGGVNFVAAAGDHLDLVSYDGTNWREFGRSVAPGGGGAAVDTYRWTVNGKPTVQTAVDNAWIAPRAGTITRITLYRKTGGTSGSTIVDVNKNGTTVYTTQGNRPTVAFNAGADAIDATTDMDVTAVAQDDRLQVDVDAVDAGQPQDISVMLEIEYT